jgi:hypothetical protein
MYDHQPIPQTVAEARLICRAVQATDAGRYTELWTDFWLSDDVAQFLGADRRWLDDFGRRFEDACRGSRLSREDRLRCLARRLSMQARHGPNRRAAEFFLQFIDQALTLAGFERLVGGPSPETNRARAFHMAVRLIRYVREQARKAGYEPDLSAVDLMVIAEVAREILSGEGISVTDVPTAMREFTAHMPLEEWVDPPTTH